MHTASELQFLRTRYPDYEGAFRWHTAPPTAKMRDELDAEWQSARAAKNWAHADMLRAVLKNGDGKEWIHWSECPRMAKMREELLTRWGKAKAAKDWKEDDLLRTCLENSNWLYETGPFI